MQGRYRLEGELGRGGGGVTWRARREPGGEPVCLKELRWATMGNLDDERRFAREGELLEALDHPAIPRHHGAFAWGEGRAHALYIAQELVVGDNLETLRRARGSTLPEALATGAEVADVLAYLHARTPPVVHRDIKPSNIMRRVDGRLLLIDFGAARLAGLGQSQVSVAGTFGYMAPEQIRGEAGPPADIYGLGMTLAVLLSGAAPEDLLGPDNRPAFSRIAGLRSDVRELLEAMCAIDPAARPSASEVARRCRALLAGRVAPREPAPAVSARAAQQSPSARPGSGLRVAILMTVLVIAGGAAFMTFTITDQVTSTVERAFEAARIEPPVVVTSSPAPPVATAAPSSAPTPVREAAVPVTDPLPLVAEECARGGQSACESLARDLGRNREALVALKDWPAPLTRGCEAGVALACQAAAEVHAQGIGVPASRLQTRAFFEKACAAGGMSGCAAFGHMLLRGDGGPTDWKAAQAPLERACDAGDDDACLSVGAILAEGKGARVDRPRALSIFEGLCKKGGKAACDNVDAMVGNNWGLPANAQAKSETLARLCESRSGVACERLGDAYLRGSGVKKDAVRARESYARGCDYGQKTACDKMR